MKPAGIILKPTPLPVKPFPLPITGLPIEASGSDADFYYAQTPQAWAVKQVGGYGANINGGTTHGPWDLTMGKGVRIAVLDSGVDAAHPDIAPNLVLNMTEVEQSALPSACDDGSPQDQQGHGTWVASLAAGAVGAGTGMVIGVAPQASILNIKVLQRMPGAGSGQAAQCAAGQASGLLSWVIQGIEDAVNQKADVISLSLGVMVDLYTGEGTGLQASFDAVTQAAAAQGVVIVAAAGNDGFDYSNTRYMEIPAQSRDVLAVVASTNPDCMENLSVNAACAAGPPTLAYYSNYGAPMNAVAAPGGSFPEGPDGSWSGFVRGACSASGCFNLGNVQYVQAYGTSASAPLVAGVVALLKSAHPEWDAAMLAAQIRATATPSAGMSYGVVNAAAALGMQ
jgi:subtilisin family serine protease